MKNQFSVLIPAQEIRRIDLYLSHIYPDASRSYINRLIDTGYIRVNGQSLGINRRVRRGDRVDIEFATEKYYLDGEAIPLEIIYETSLFAVISKDAGVNTHTFPGEYGKSGTLLNALLYHYGDECVIDGVERPGIVHRLDKDTSGLILIAKNDQAMKALQKKIADRDIRKIYYAVVSGQVQEKEGMIESYIGRDPNDHKRMTTQSPVDPKLAQTKYTLLASIGDQYSLLEIELFTGRTHQIRVHLADLGHPIIGDKVYGDAGINVEVAKEYGLKRQWLHARGLQLELFGIEYDFVAPLKGDLQKILEDHGIVVDV